jgi:hypothetical protein
MITIHNVYLVCSIRQPSTWYRVHPAQSSGTVNHLACNRYREPSSSNTVQGQSGLLIYGIWYREPSSLYQVQLTLHLKYLVQGNIQLMYLVQGNIHLIYHVQGTIQFMYLVQGTIHLMYQVQRNIHMINQVQGIIQLTNLVQDFIRHMYLWKISDIPLKCNTLHPM